MPKKGRLLGNVYKDEYIADDSRDDDDNYLDKGGNVKKAVAHEKSQVAPNLSQEGQLCVTDELCRHLRPGVTGSKYLNIWFNTLDFNFNH